MSISILDLETNNNNLERGYKMAKMQSQNMFQQLSMKAKELNENQYVRELCVNAQEANADYIRFDTEWNGIENKGVYRQIVWDNGDGMTATELDEYMANIGTGEKEHAIDKNRHIGARVSTAPFNKEGVIVFSLKDESLNVLWYHKHENDIVLKEFDGKKVCMYCNIPEEIEQECLEKYG